MNIPTPADPVMEMAERIADELFPSAYDDAEHAAALIAAQAAIRATTEAAAKYHDRKAAKWRKEASRHTRSDGRRSDCEQRDLIRMVRHQSDAIALRANKHIKGSDR